ncbi:ATP-dependent RecD-like DNA helicase [Kordia antarctica]|uniref:ATP-dependent RecD-like DNA helicase n=1 Tax=Kordia antarctica TaxID=1218801 RepID=A0A7L4ZI29_9FLAO|nr:AAA domain-containing protein [Kordia antarctica]QHI36393.1 ATP-dependent RecD-like DNA helicase [Kordia antarctica]
MNHINKFEITQSLKKFNDIVQLYLAEDKLGKIVEILLIKTPQNQKKYVDRVLRYEIDPICNEINPLVQRIIQYGYDEENEVHFIAYEYNTNEEKDEFTVNDLIKVLKTLNHLKNQNRYGFYISPLTIAIYDDQPEIKFLGLLKVFALFDAIDTDCLAPEFKKNYVQSFQSDMYAVFNRFKDILNHSDNNTLHEIFEKALALNKIDRYNSYKDVIDVLGKYQKTTIQSVSYSKTVTVSVKSELMTNFQTVMDEMNEESFLLVSEEKSKEHNNVQGQFSTENYSGNFFANSDNSIFILADRIKNYTNKYVNNNGFVSEYKFGYESFNSFNISQYFENKWKEANDLGKLHKKETALITKWKTLPQKEQEFIEEKAFKAIYTSCSATKKKSNNLIFQLSKKFRDWYFIRELRKNNIKLAIDDKVVGIIHKYNQKDYQLIIQDAEITIDDIPKSGKLIEDVTIEISQFKKQVYACTNFSKREVVNPELCTKLIKPEHLIIETPPNLDYVAFENTIINERLKNDESQLESVLEALHRKPLYLIQGPPGTGKTTVIVELVEQMVLENKNVKILITSQSNLAVDNVLERLPDTILFMRLASDEDRITASIKMHSFTNKLSDWVEKTKKASKDYLDSKLRNSKTDNEILKFKTALKNSGNDKKFTDFQNYLYYQNNYIKRKFEKVKSLAEVDLIFDKHLDLKVSKLRAIQRDWFSFLSNADTDKGKQKVSMLHTGTTEIDLKTALLQSTNVIGATCIHIASGQYQNIDFKFDYVIMDESSKATPAESLVPINMAKNVIMIGDHKQLPPVVTREKAVKEKIKEELEDNGLDIQKEFGESLFEKLITTFENNDKLSHYYKMLSTQYRMPRQLGNLISTYFYKENPLRNPSKEIISDYDIKKSHGLQFKKPLTKIMDLITKKIIEVPTSVVMISTSDSDNPYDNGDKKKRANECNRSVINEILVELNKQYQGNAEKEYPFTIGIIAGYRGQVELLKSTIKTDRYKNFKILHKDKNDTSLIDINTVDKFQGAERDIIIYDIVKSSEAVSSIGFLDDYRRINVAFSRAKKLLIIVGDHEYILKRAHLHEKSEFKDFKLKEIVRQLEEQGVIVHNFKNILQ